MTNCGPAASANGSYHAQTNCPDTSTWKTADDHNSNYIFAQHVANKIIPQLSTRYREIGRQTELLQSYQDCTDSPYKVVKYNTFTSKNLQNKDETEYYLKIEVDADGFKYVIAHTGVTPDYLTVLYGSWTTNT